MLSRKNGRSSLLFAAFALACQIPCTFAQAPQTLHVTVEGQPTITLDRASLAAMPHVNVTTPAIHHQPAARWQGVALSEVLRRAGAPAGESLRGRALTTVVRVTAADRYQVVFSLGELDPSLGHEEAIVADTQDGHPLQADGPFRLIVPGDNRPARWVRNVVAIEAANDAAPTR